MFIKGSFTRVAEVNVLRFDGNCMEYVWKNEGKCLVVFFFWFCLVERVKKIIKKSFFYSSKLLHQLQFCNINFASQDRIF